MKEWNRNYWKEDSPEREGYIYLIEAVGVLGIIPGCYIKRFKIGLSTSPEARLENFHNNQPPVDMVLVKKIFVSDMKQSETALHKKFKKYNVKLKRSKEFFDIPIWIMPIVNWEFHKQEVKNYATLKFPFKFVLIISAILVGGGAVLGNNISSISFTNDTTQNQSIPAKK